MLCVRQQLFLKILDIRLFIEVDVARFFNNEPELMTCFLQIGDDPLHKLCVFVLSNHDPSLLPQVLRIVNFRLG